jgi:hypothetical protein
MKIVLLLCLVVAAAATEEVESNPFVDFVEGFALGLHVELIAPSIKVCAVAIQSLYKAVEGFIQALSEHQTFYNLMNNATKGIATISPVCRRCYVVPMDFWRQMNATYFQKFNQSWLLYFQSVGLNTLYRTQDVGENVLKIKAAFESKDYLNAGFYIGDAVNIIFNVTSLSPIPRPAPSSDPMVSPLDLPVDLPVDGKGELRQVVPMSGPRTDWEDVHKKFRLYYNYSMLVLNYTKWINATTSNNLNSSVMGIEMNLYTGIKLLKDPTMVEGVMTLIDIVLDVNGLFNGIYFAIVQIPQKMLKDTVFEHIDYLWLNLLQHVGYFIYHGYRLVEDILAHKYLDMVRRTTIIARRFLYFDEDVLDDIHNGVSVNDI